MDFLIYIAVIGFKYWCNDMWFTRSTYLPAGDGEYAIDLLMSSVQVQVV